MANAGIGGSDVQDVMLEAVEGRFGGVRAPHPVEMLTDNGSAERAKDTRIFARQLGLRLCFTPVRSPQSNGISEAFAHHTLKRDCVQVTLRPDAASALALIDARFDDYNHHHPHSGPKMHSPREFIAAQTATACMSGQTGAGSADDLGATAQIKQNPTRAQRQPLHWTLHKEPHFVERFFNRIKRFRRIARRCEKTVNSFRAFACAMAGLAQGKTPP